MSIYSLPPLISSILFIVLGFFVFIRSKKNISFTLPFFLTSLATFWWQFSWFILFNTKNLELIPYLVRIGYAGITFIPGVFFHFYSTYIEEKRNKKWIGIYYSIAVIFLFLLWGTDLYVDGYYVYSWGYYPKAGVLHPIYLCYLVVVALHSFCSLIVSGNKARWNGIRSDQIKYLILSFFIYCFAASDFIVNYGIGYYPLGFSAILVCLFIVAHAIVRYHLMDITLAITRAGIFVCVYTLVLGIPLGIAFGLRDNLIALMGQSWIAVPLIAATSLATGGPYVYMFFQKRAEARLLQEQRGYQATLRQASFGMGRVKDLNRLLNLIVHIIKRTVHVDHCEVFLIHEDSQQYVLKASRADSSVNAEVNAIAVESVLIRHFSMNKEPIIYEEIKQQIEQNSKKHVADLKAVMQRLKGEFIVPSYIEDQLVAFIVLGEKHSNKLYTADDIAIFSILANQAALAIENAQFYEDMKSTQEQLFKAEKMATLGTMADGLSHQINNRLHAMGFVAGDALDTIKLKDLSSVSAWEKEMIAEIGDGLARIQDNVKRGGEVVEGLLKYTRKSETGFGVVDLQEVINAAFEMAQFKITSGAKLELRCDFAKNIPQISGNFTQLQEVFFNIIDNAYDATRQRKEELKEEGYKPELRVTTAKEGDSLVIKVKDNGMGAKAEDRSKIFTPFFTTKLSSKKGTGLGMYVIHQIIEENHGGSVEFDSTYQEGSTITIKLPIFRQELVHDDRA